MTITITDLEQEEVEQEYGLISFDGEAFNWADVSPAIHLYHDPSDMWMMLHQNTWELYGGEGEDNRMMVQVDLNTGEVTFADDYEPDEAAKSFWNTIGSLRPTTEDSYSEYEKQANMYKGLYHDTADILREVRHTLNVPEGEDIIEHARNTVSHLPNCSWHEWDHRFSWSDSDCICSGRTAVSAPPGIADDMPESYEMLPGGESISAGLEDINYFRNKLAALSLNPNADVTKLEKQIELLEDAVVIHKLHTLPYATEEEINRNAFDDAMKVID